MKITAKNVFTSSFSKAVHLVGAGHDPLCQFKRKGSPVPTFVFSPRARTASDQYAGLRAQVQRVPFIDPPDPAIVNESSSTSTTRTSTPRATT